VNLTLSPERAAQSRRIVNTILREPFQAHTWRELMFFLISSGVAALGVGFALVTMAAGLFLAIVVVGLLILAVSLRGLRGIGGWQRALAAYFLDELIPDPEPLSPRPGFFGWLASSLTDRAGWRALGYTVLKVPLTIFGVWFALSIWVEAAAALLYPITRGNFSVSGFGLIHRSINPGDPGPGGFLRPQAIFVYGAILLFIAPWTMRLVVYIDRRIMWLLLGPDATTARVRTLEQSRARTVDASAAMLRRIERNLHDGTQAQLVAMAMRLGQVKEKLADPNLDAAELDQVRRLIDEAHYGAKEAIVELRDLARGIHPPVLDTGLEQALTTLTARAAVPSELDVRMSTRPTPAIEAIAYFCVAELLANVAQHAQATRASVSCIQHGEWLRVVVRDDGRGGAAICDISAERPAGSSGLAGLTDRVRDVDGHFSVASPPGGPTVVIVDLPCHA
jgi:signal transduction histidine kinase